MSCTCANRHCRGKYSSYTRCRKWSMPAELASTAKTKGPRRAVITLKLTYTANIVHHAPIEVGHRALLERIEIRQVLELVIKMTNCVAHELPLTLGAFKVFSRQAIANRCCKRSCGWRSETTAASQNGSSRPQHRPHRTSPNR